MPASINSNRAARSARVASKYVATWRLVWTSRCPGLTGYRSKRASASALDSTESAASQNGQPIAARARVEVSLTHPALTWSGPAYFDTNTGTAPLEDDFAEWDWCRAPMRDATAVLYNATRRDGTFVFYRIEALPPWASLVVDALRTGGVPPEALRMAKARLAAFSGRPARRGRRVA